MSALAAVATGLALKAAVILGLGLALGRLLRRASAISRHFLWSGVLVGALALPVLSAILPVWEPVAWPAVVTFEPGGLTPEPPAPAPRAATADALPAAPIAEPLPLPPPRAETPSATGAGLGSWILGVAAGGAAVFLGLLGRSVRRLGRVVRAGRRLESDDPRRTRLVRHARALGLSRIPRVVESESATVPFVWGILRPTIVLPSASAGWSDTRVDAVLLHELAHIRHGDVPVRLAAEIVCACHWFNPLAWTTARRLRAAGEAACDDAVLAAGVRPADYAGELLGISVEQRWHLRAAGAMAGTSPIGRRIEGILEPGRVRAGSPRTRWATAAGLLGLVLPVAAFAPGRQESPVALPSGRAPTNGVLPVQFRFQTDGSAGVVFTEGSVDLGATGPDRRADDEAGFLLVVRRDGSGPLRTAWVTGGATASRRVRDDAGDRDWSAREPAWLEATLRLAAGRLGERGRTIRQYGAPLNGGDGPRERAAGSVMVGLPATTEDGSRGTLVAGWRQDGRRAGLFACAAPDGGPDTDAARGLLDRVTRSGSLDALGSDACLVVYTWDADASRLRVVEAWRTGAGPLRVRAADGDAPLTRTAAEAWLAEVLPAALEALR